jgi:hypothetical protein
MCNGDFLAGMRCMATRQQPAPDNGFAILIGRLAAVWTHPVAAWRCSDRAARIALVSGYIAAGYAIVLTALQFYQV